VPILNRVHAIREGVLSVLKFLNKNIVICGTFALLFTLAYTVARYIYHKMLNYY
jgi:hypothetical protein